MVATTVSAPLVVTPNTPTVVVSAPATGDGGSSYTMGAPPTLSPNNGGTATLPNPLPNLLFNFYQGTTLLGSATAVYTPVTFQYIASFSTSAIAPGTSNITATYVGDANYATASASETVVLGATSVSFNLASPATITAGAGVATTIKAIVTPAVGTVTPVAGTVSFYDGTTLLGTAVPVVSTVTPTTTTGVATLSTIFTVAGAHTINAVYSGDTHFTGSTGTLAATVVTTAPAFTIALSPTALTIAQGSSQATTVTATVTGNWAGTVPVTCTGLPADSYCLFNYAGGSPTTAFTLTGANGTFSGTLTVVTKNTFVPSSRSAGLFWLPALFLAGLLGLGRKQLSTGLRKTLLVALLLSVSLATTACGTQYLGTPLGMSSVTVHATGTGSTSASPAQAPTATLSVTVTQ